jgi:hypothetical protein
VHNTRTVINTILLIYTKIKTPTTLNKATENITLKMEETEGIKVLTSVKIMICPIKFQVKLCTNMKMAVFWVAAPCRMVRVYSFIALTMEAVQTSEIQVKLYQSTRR